VKPFVDKMAEKMDYTVAVDDARKTSKAYMEAYGQNGIPTSFIVNKEGKIVKPSEVRAAINEVEAIKNCFPADTLVGTA